MKTNTVLFRVIVCVFSFSCYAQSIEQTIAHAGTGKTQAKVDSKSNEDLVIDSYLVVEVINMPFGKRTTKYEVSKLDMVYTNDLGPNNTRTVTPIYKKAKVRKTEMILPSKAIVDTMSQKIKPIKVEVITPAYTENSANINILNTYAHVLDKGYKSVDMLKKVADKFYFEDNYEEAAKYYSKLIDLEANLEAVFYFRYAQSLKAISEIEKAEEMMKLFESKNGNSELAKK